VSRRSPHRPDFNNPYWLLTGHNATFHPVDPDADDGDAIYAIDQGGFVMTRDETMELFHRVIAGIDALGDDRIAAHNEQLDEKHFGDPPRERSSASRAAAAPPLRRERPGDVYLITNGHLYKIGVSTDTVRRLREIERASGMPVTILAKRAVLDMLSYEQERHERYASYRREGEWFDLSNDELDALIAELGS